MKIRRTHILLAALGFLLCAFPFRSTLKRPVITVYQTIKGKKSVSDRVEQYGEAARTRLAPHFEAVDADYPPEHITLVGIKQEGVLEVWINEPPILLTTYPIKAKSGVLGPKLQEGDFQIPEGLYDIESLNPNSLYHLALRVNYPNDHDKERGREDGRTDLGSDIMIHGKDVSIGCLAMGDEAIEEIFILAAETGIEHISVILTPIDFRKEDLPENRPPIPEWTGSLYESIRNALP